MKTTLTIFACFSLLAGCGAPTIDDSNDPESISADGKADTASSTSTYYTLRPDTRRCVYPLCGGEWIKRVNFDTTKCVDGSWADECRVLDVDYSALAFTDVERAGFENSAILVRGTIAKTQVNGSTYGVLKVSEVWKPATETASHGIVYRVNDLGIKCITTPCVAQHEAKLDSTISRNIAGWDLSESDATDAQKDDMSNAFFSGEKVLMAGYNVYVTGPGGQAVQLQANQFYRQVEHVATCAANEFNDVQDACGTVANVAGICKPVATYCYMLYKPVCGCDGHTYSNDCVRVHNKVQLAYAGECHP
jgi:hypothetical protein